MLSFLKEYWWLILLLPLGALINTIKELNQVKYKRYLLPKQTPTSDNKSVSEKKGLNRKQE